MGSSADWQNPITAPAGQRQSGLDPLRLLPARVDLFVARLDFQRALLRAGRTRLTPILVTREGVIVDGHHAVRAAAEEGRLVEVLVSELVVTATASSILSLPVR